MVWNFPQQITTVNIMNTCYSKRFILNANNNVQSVCVCTWIHGLWEHSCVWLNGYYNINMVYKDTPYVLINQMA